MKDQDFTYSMVTCLILAGSIISASLLFPFVQRAACEALGVVINVVTSDPENWFLRYVPAHSLVKREIFLSYVSPVHYNSIRRRPRGAAPMLRSLSSLGRRDSRILAALDEYERTNAVPENPQALAEAAIR